LATPRTAAPAARRGAARREEASPWSGIAQEHRTGRHRGSSRCRAHRMPTRPRGLN
jgi:hypothetical protein